MNKKARAKRNFSAEAKANIREGGAKRSNKAAAANVAAVRAAMTEIEKEIAENGGLYPHATKLNISEVARRSSVTLTVLYKKQYEDFKNDVNGWLDRMDKKPDQPDQAPAEKQTSPLPDEHTSPRRTLKERVRDWKEQYERLKDSHIKTELDLLGANDAIVKLSKQVDELRGQLRAQAELRIVPMPNRPETPRLADEDVPASGVMAAIQAKLEAYLNDCEFGYRSQPEETRKPTIPSTSDGKVNVRAVAQAIGLRQTQEKYLFEREALTTLVNVVARGQGLAPIGARVSQDPADKVVLERVALQAQAMRQASRAALEAQAMQQELLETIKQNGLDNQRLRAEVMRLQARLEAIESGILVPVEE